MGLGIKRTCGTCDAKFYDLEKSPIICPKCGTNYDDFLKSKSKKTKKEISEEIDDIDLELDDVDEIEALEDLDEGAQIEDLDEEIRESMEMEEDDGVARDKAASDDEMLDLDGESDGMIDSGDPDDEIADDDK